MEQTRFAKIVMVWAFLLCFGGSMECMAQSKPLWITQGEKSMNHKRESENYVFKVFNTHGRDAEALKSERLRPLLEYLESEYGVKTTRMVVDTTAVDAAGAQVTKITLPTDETTAVVYAKLVDDYSEFTDYELNVFQHEYYQLYAVTNRDAAPTFDDFSIEESHNGTALTYSIVPGLGQLYKGQTAKACVFFGGEVVLVGTAVVAQVYKHRADTKVRNHTPNVDSWKSKSKSWKQVRNISLGLACGLYVYNLIDAATAKAGHRVKVGKSSTLNVALVPTPTLGAGVGMTLTF